MRAGVSGRFGLLSSGGSAGLPRTESGNAHHERNQRMLTMNGCVAAPLTEGQVLNLRDSGHHREDGAMA